MDTMNTTCTFSFKCTKLIIRSAALCIPAIENFDQTMSRLFSPFVITGRLFRARVSGVYGGPGPGINVHNNASECRETSIIQMRRGRGPAEREAGLRVSTLHRFSDPTQVPRDEDISVTVTGPSTAASITSSIVCQKMN